ncbi:flavin monoamine oxidase family protein [Staphylococcus massiliensis]|uniref:Amine oxidase domain-containing protein n=2 Tax=Staphylococcus TaxID=1279 RepID=K9AS88_9STAP|nr:FAD-dependent oxidoreductase [Staphylococcus massiliensis]ADA81071.1 hypothetical protein SAP089B_017 [Staphylococcus aureus]EKU45487.1 hypothetical protein C273_11206 [Staphylococcus massiliensis S46]
MTNRITMKDIEHIDGINKNNEVDIAIIGAGVSGLYSAYRFLEDPQYSQQKIGIYDLSDKIGGRLESTLLPESNVSGELGGMRYLTSQKITTTLIENIFNLNNERFELGNPSHHTFYLRGQRFKEDAWESYQKDNSKFQTRYFMHQSYQGYHPDQLFNKVIADVCLNDRWFTDTYGERITIKDNYNITFKLTKKEWDDIKLNLVYYKEGSPYDGLPISRIGFWNLLKDMLGNEGYAFLADAGGYYSNTLSWNSAEAFSYMVGDFTDNVEYKTIKNGYDQLAYAIGEKVSKSPQVSINLKTELKTFEKLDSMYQLEMVNLNTQEMYVVKASHIILAMPKRSLELLDQDNFFFEDASNSKLRKLVDTVYAEPSLKLLLGFDSPWWKECLGAEHGKSSTDLPMRQCYYFGTDEANNKSLLLASYNDMRTVNFWKSMMKSKENKCIKLDEVKSKCSELDLYNEEYSDEVTNVMVKESIEELKELHDIEIPMPYVAMVKDWSADPFGGGYHAWYTGINVKEVMKEIRKPYFNESIYIVGEAYSSDQGWTEGAFKTAENMLQDHFQLNWPDWLEKEYYLGW